MNKPLVSCQCITYNRPELLEEAIESFHRQDYECDKELVILNDGAQTLVYDHPEVKIINSPIRFNSIGEKRNACVALCKGDVIFPWDDDDISLPWRISYSLEKKGSGRYWKNKRAWCWQNGKIKPEPVHNVYHAMGCWDKSLFIDVGGYPFIQSGQDGAIEKRFSTTGERKVELIPNEKVFYIYKFGGTGHPHLSSMGYGKGFDEEGKKETVYLKPQWKDEYI